MTDVLENDLAPWLALLPADTPVDYLADCRAEAQAMARQAQLAGLVAGLEGRLAADLADVSVDPSTLTAAASELASARTLASALPAVVPVNQARHAEVAASLPHPYKGNFLMPRPPAFAGELIHSLRVHAPDGELPPVAGPLDLEAIEMYEQVSVESAQAWSSLAILANGPTPMTMASFVGAWDAITNVDAWPLLHEHILELADLIVRADAERPDPVPCSRSMSAHGSWRLQAAEGGAQAAPWSFKEQVRNGVLVVPTPEPWLLDPPVVPTPPDPVPDPVPDPPVVPTPPDPPVVVPVPEATPSRRRSKSLRSRPR